MTERMEHFDEDLDFGVSSKLSADLDALFEPQLPVPAEVDRAIMDKANRHFVRREFTKGGRRRLRWVGLWRIAAVAAIVIFAFSLDLTKRPEPTTNGPVFAETLPIDIDGNGRVDILDAFKLARQIESADSAEIKLDVNGDGKVNRDDVDLVASAAVRLDKGVL